MLALALLVPLAAVGEPTNVTNFNRGALLGEVASTAALQHDFDQRYSLIAEAGVGIGLTADDVANVRDQIRAGLARYVELPRHLDAMAGQRAGHTFALHDVNIPPDVYGWQVDLLKDDQTLMVYVPNRCGNISYVRLPKQRELAAAPIERTQPLMAPQETVADIAPPAADVPAPTVVAVAPIVAVPAAAAPHLAWLGALLVPILLHGGGTTGGGGGGSTRILPTPAPIHTICPPPAVIHH